MTYPPISLAEPGKLVILLAGSRDYTDRPRISRFLFDIIHQVAPAQIVVRHGACPTGADQLTAFWCRVHTPLLARSGRTLVEQAMPAKWDLCAPDCPKKPHRVPRLRGDVVHPGVLPDYCPKAGPRRSAAMIAAGADVCLGFPLLAAGTSYGTRKTMKLAEKAGIPVRDASSAVRL